MGRRLGLALSGGPEARALKPARSEVRRMRPQHGLLNHRRMIARQLPPCWRGSSRM